MQLRLIQRSLICLVVSLLGLDGVAARHPDLGFRVSFVVIFVFGDVVEGVAIPVYIHR